MAERASDGTSLAFNASNSAFSPPVVAAGLHPVAAHGHRPGTDEAQLALCRDYVTNPPLYPAVHDWFRRSQVPLLAVRGEGEEIFGPDGARAFARDLPDAETYLGPGGHFLLGSALDTVTVSIRGVLRRTLSTG